MAPPIVSKVLTILNAPGHKHDIILKYVILALCAVLAFFLRLYAVIRFESVIHEFDPYFNYRSTMYLVNEGFYKFHNWFDAWAWYPLGRIVGGTIYPGLMVTAAIIYWTFHFFNITIAIRNVCVLLAPCFAGLTSFTTYLFTREVARSPTRSGESTGVLAAALIAIVPGYISRSVAGSYDNEAVAIFALIFTYYLFMKAVNEGSMLYAAFCSLSYFYMVSAWGGYIFIINLIPLYVFVQLLAGRYTHRLYVAYCTLYVLGTLLSMQITFVGFQPVYSSEHVAAFGVFGLLQLYNAVVWIREQLGPQQFATFLRLFFSTLGVIFAIVLGVLTATGYVAPWTGRFYSLLDPTYAKEHIPIIASVSEHQPTTWGSFFFDLNILVFMLPAGLYFCFKDMTDGSVFAIMYAVTSVYFAGVMVRLMLVLAPVACVVGAIGISSTLQRYIKDIKPQQSSASTASSSTPAPPKGKQSKKQLAKANEDAGKREVAYVIIAGLTFMLFMYSVHCCWVTQEAYSSPSIVLAARGGGGGKIIFDDFREAYYWLRMNTAEDAKIMSWWDYGYQLTAIANRTVIVDNNTWNNTHIATVGTAMASTEEVAYETLLRLDVDYVLVIFGGLTGFASDDINKFLWMVRIGGGVFPRIQEKDYYGSNNQYSIGKEASPTMLNSLMYKLCYYRFGQVMTEYEKPQGYDRVRQTEIGNKDFELEYVEEAYTSEHWLVRIYKVKKPNNRGVLA